MTLAEVARFAQCSPGHVSNIERGETRGVSRKRLLLLAEAVRLPKAEREKWDLVASPSSEEEVAGLGEFMAYAHEGFSEFFSDLDALAKSYESIQWTLFDLNTTENEVQAFRDAIRAGMSAESIRIGLSERSGWTIPAAKANLENLIVTRYRLARCFQELSQLETRSLGDLLNLLEKGGDYAQAGLDTIAQRALMPEDQSRLEWFEVSGRPRYYRLFEAPIWGTLALLRLRTFHVLNSKPRRETEARCTIEGIGDEVKYLHWQAITRFEAFRTSLAGGTCSPEIEHVWADTLYREATYYRNYGSIVRDKSLIKHAQSLYYQAIEKRRDLILALDKEVEAVKPFVRGFDHIKELARYHRALGLAFLREVNGINQEQREAHAEAQWNYGISGRLHHPYERRNKQRFDQASELSAIADKLLAADARSAFTTLDYPLSTDRW